MILTFKKFNFKKLELNQSSIFESYNLVLFTCSFHLGSKYTLPKKVAYMGFPSGISDTGPAVSWETLHWVIARFRAVILSV